MRLSAFLAVALYVPTYCLLDSLPLGRLIQRANSDISSVLSSFVPSPSRNMRGKNQKRNGPDIAEQKQRDSPLSFFSKMHTPTSDVRKIQETSMNLLRVTKLLARQQERDPFFPSLPLLPSLDLGLDILQKLSLRDVMSILKNFNVVLPSQEPKKESPKDSLSSPCDESVQYRELNGMCNNLRNPCWGKINEAYSRWLPPDYQDGIEKPRARHNGSDLPNPRILSTTLNNRKGKESHLTKLSAISMIWGQFVAHDISLTPTFVHTSNATENGEEEVLIPDCCGEDRLHPECFPIFVDHKDPFFPKGHCIDFVRSSAYVFNPNGCDQPKLGFPRQQLNQVTPFLDASTIYGSSEEVLRSLRSHDGKGALLEMKENENGPILNRDVRMCRSFSDNCDSHCMLSGEIRVSETPGLASLHTLWVREHNRLAQIFLSNGWDEENAFQETRKIVTAMIQHITFNEFLPSIIGPEMMSSRGLYPTFEKYEYDMSIDPRIINSFATAAYRYGHSMVGEDIGRFGKHPHQNHPLVSDLFAVDEFCDLASDPLIRLIGGHAQQKSQNVDNIFAKDLTNHLFASGPDEIGLDLLSINIQRGRDHGLPSYNHWRKRCGMARAKSFDFLNREIPMEILLQLENIYGHDCVDDIDLYVAGISEKHLNQASVGPTFACIIAEQFRRLKYGDRFWYENLNHLGSFTKEQLLEIKKTTLSAVICRNIEIPEIQMEIFSVTSNNNPLIHCDQVIKKATLNINLW